MNAPRTFGAAELRELERRAAASPRLRANLNLHEGDAAALHRFIITMLRGSYVRPHRHMAAHKLEMATVLAGEFEWLFFDDAGQVTRREHLRAGGDRMAIEVPPGVWHGLLALTPTASFLEVKQGPYDAATDKQFAPWAPDEGAAGAQAYHESLYAGRTG